jgi:hypothetical protein
LDTAIHGGLVVKPVRAKHDADHLIAVHRIVAGEVISTYIPHNSFGIFP